MRNGNLLAEKNINFLRQAQGLIEQLDDTLFTHVNPPMFRSGVGSHIRHDLDHYLNFVAGIKTGEIDYEARKRDIRIEKNRKVALELIEYIVGDLSLMQPEDGNRPVQVKTDSDGEAAEAVWAPSTFTRELDFLLSHTVHHFGLIAMILRFQGFEPGENFGVAPSTIRYLENNTSCAL